MAMTACPAAAACEEYNDRPCIGHMVDALMPSTTLVYACAGLHEPVGMGEKAVTGFVCLDCR